jgi:hypothetical protein
MLFLAQADIAGTLVWFVMFFVLIFLYPRLMLSQMIYKIEQSAIRMEAMTKKSMIIVNRKAGGRREDKNKIDAFTEFFVVEPSAIDPYGLVKKIDAIVRSMEDRFDQFVDELVPHKNYNDKQDINYGLRAAIGLKQMSKIVRHYVELAKKFKNLQIAMILQMQLPIIEKIAESELKGTEAFVNEWPVGDSIGALAAAEMMEDSKEVAEDVMMDTTTIDGRKCFVLKAKGPAPHLGRVDEAVELIMKKHKIARIVTIDAGLKLEGEPTGAVAEGVGFAMGGWGEREIIENFLLPKKIRIDSIVVKVGFEEALVPMKKEIFNSTPKVHEYIKRSVARAKKGDNIIIIGVGNSCGIGNNKKELKDVKPLVEQLDRKLKKEEKETKKRRWI